MTYDGITLACLFQTLKTLSTDFNTYFKSLDSHSNHQVPSFCSLGIFPDSFGSASQSYIHLYSAVPFCFLSLFLLQNLWVYEIVLENNCSFIYKLWVDKLSRESLPTAEDLRLPSSSLPEFNSRKILKGED